MNRLRSRLRALEAARMEHVDEVRRAPERLATMLAAKAERLAQPLRENADGCVTAPAIDVMAVALDEVGSDTLGEAVWHRVRELASKEGFVGRVFAELVAFVER